jgi:hypothetical protein
MLKKDENNISIEVSMLKHAADAIEGKDAALWCGESTNGNVVSWVATYPDSKLRDGQQYSLFKELVTCPGCLKSAKGRLEEICPMCGADL